MVGWLLDTIAVRLRLDVWVYDLLICINLVYPHGCICIEAFVDDFSFVG